MFRKYIYIVIVAVLIAFQSNAQIKPGVSGTNRQNGSEQSSDSELSSKKAPVPAKPKIPSFIKTWQVGEQGTLIKKTELDTTLTFYHAYQPIYQKSISNTFIGNNGGAYISNDFFQRSYNSDFYFARSFDAYWLTPSQINYFNTTTPYSLLDYSQSDKKNTKNETRFNVFFSQNVNKKLNFEFIYNQTKSQGQYTHQQNKFHNIALVSSYNSNNFLSHSNIIFNRLEGQENGGVEANQSPNAATEDLSVRMDDASHKLQNNTIFTVNEYRLGKTIEADSAENIVEKFIPRVGFIHEFEFTGNKRKFTKTDNSNAFFTNNYINTGLTNDSVRYSRLTNIFQIKFYEAPDRKFTFGKRVYIGHDELWYHESSQLADLGAKPFPLIGSYFYSTSTSPISQLVTNKFFNSKQTNTFIGGGIFRNEGKFWQWEADGRIYLVGYRTGQTELNGYLNKPIKIGRDTTSLRIEGSLKTLVPDYFDSYFFSNNYIWKNNFSNINEMTIKSSIHSQEYKTTIGVNYSLIGNYIYNDNKALPVQASSELLILSAYLNKDFESDHWIIRTQALVQKANNENIIHLPAFAGFLSINYRTLWSKVMYTQLGIDTRYNSNFYADAYDPATARFYLQNKQLIGKYPYIDLHVNLKLKRTRFFFVLMNAGSGLLGNNYYMAPDYPYYRRTYRIGVSWSFYD